MRPLHPGNISFALVCGLLCALAGIVSASRIATARLVFVIAYSISRTLQLHKICVGVKECDATCLESSVPLMILLNWAVSTPLSAANFFCPPRGHIIGI